MSRPDIKAYVEGRDHFGGNSFVEVGTHQIEMNSDDALLIEAAISQAVQVERERGEENYRAFAEVTEAYWKLEAAVKAHVAARASGRSVDIGETYRNLVASLRSEGASPNE